MFVDPNMSDPYSGFRPWGRHNRDYNKHEPHLLFKQPKTVLVDLGFRGVDSEVSSVHLIHRGKHRTLTSTQRRWLKRRQAIEPIIGHVKHDHGMRRCWLKGQTGDALHAVLCATGYNLRWLLRAIVRLGLRPIFFILALAALDRQCPVASAACAPETLPAPHLPAPTKCPDRRRASSKLNFAGPTNYLGLTVDEISSADVRENLTNLILVPTSPGI